jgi:spermidine synthase
MLTVELGASLLLLTHIPRNFLPVGLIVTILVTPSLVGIGRIAATRNFFGTYQVIDQTMKYGKTYRALYHGAIAQGIQIVAPTISTEPRMYFWPMGDLFQHFQFRDIAMLGLGTGTALCFNDGTRRFTVYEISPAMVELARQWFTYISSCGEPTWRIGDARLLLRQDADARYDLIFLDAFSSASIPTHLITREALDLYRSRLKPDGILLWNVNSLYYDLAKPLAALANAMDWQAWKRYDESGNFTADVIPSHFVLLAPRERDLSALRTLGWEQLPATDFPVWRDDFTNILAALNLKVMSHAQTP